MTLRYSRLSGSLMLVAMLALPTLSHGGDYRVGVFAGSASKDNQAELKAMFKPLIDYIASASGENVTMEISQSFKNMDRRLGSGRYTIFLGPPQVTADAIEEGFEPVAKWDKPIFGVFIATTNTSYKSVADLKGTRVGLASRDTAAGPLCIAALNKAGIRPDQDLAAVYEGKFMDVMLNQLSQGGLDVVCAGSGAWRVLNEQEPGKYKIVGESVRVPGFALSLDSELSEPEKKKLAGILVGIGKSPEGKRALAAISGSAAGANDTLPTSVKEYKTSNRLIEENKRLYQLQVPPK